MVATAATSAFFPVPLSADPVPKPVKKGSGVPNLKQPTISRLSVKANAQAPHKVNGTPVSMATTREPVKIDNSPAAPPPRTFINQLPDWSVLLAAITTVFLAAEKQWTLLDWKPKRPDILVDPLGLGSIVQGGLVFRQDFSIRSYEIGADRTASIETIMNHLQETAINHVKSAGLLDDGFGSTPEMYKRDLIWVVTKMQVLIDRSPAWGDTVRVETWVSESGKNGMRRDWLVRDVRTGEVMARASGLWVLMNKKTRRLSKIPEEVRREIEPYFMNTEPVVENDERKLTKLDEKSADIIRCGLTPRWNDLDVNQHVNNVKYIGWILESAPPDLLESHELSALTMEYRRECGRDSVLQSLTAVVSNLDGAHDGSAGAREVECRHLLRLEAGAEVVKGRTGWRPKAARPASKDDASA